MSALSVMIAIVLTGNASENSASHFRPLPRPTAVVSATGVGYPPRHMRGAQARLMARRAAEVVATRNLAARLGLPPGARLGPFRYVSFRDLPNGAVEVTVEASVVVLRSPARPPRGP